MQNLPTVPTFEQRAAWTYGPAPMHHTTWHTFRNVATRRRSGRKISFWFPPSLTSPESVRKEVLKVVDSYGRHDDDDIDRRETAQWRQRV